MGIGSITSTGSMSVMQMTTTDLKDQKSKSIQNEITDVQQQMQKLSSKEELSANEKANERKKLQKEISGLNTELKQHQEELLRSQKREQMLAELREDADPAEKEKSEDKISSNDTSPDTANSKKPSSDETQTAQPGDVITRNSDGVVILKEIVKQERNAEAGAEENKQTDEIQEENADKVDTKTADNDTAADSRPSGKEIHALVSADTSLQQAGRLGTIIAKTSDGVAILKEEISQAKEQGIDTERKQAELDKMERQEKLAMAFQFSILGEANNAMKSAAEANVSAKDNSQADAETNAYFNALHLTQEEQASQQRFFVSFG